MPRTKTGTVRRKRHQKVLKLTKGFRGANNRLYKRAKEASLHAGQYAFAGRRRRKRDFRQLWITRISAAVKQVNESLNYSRFIAALKKADIQIDRKILAEFASRDFAVFKSIVKAAGLA